MFSFSVSFFFCLLWPRSTFNHTLYHALHIVKCKCTLDIVWKSTKKRSKQKKCISCNPLCTSKRNENEARKKEETVKALFAYRMHWRVFSKANSYNNNNNNWVHLKSTMNFETHTLTYTWNKNYIGKKRSFEAFALVLCLAIFIAFHPHFNIS